MTTRRKAGCCMSLNRDSLPKTTAAAKTGGIDPGSSRNSRPRDLASSPARHLLSPQGASVPCEGGLRRCVAWPASPPSTCPRAPSSQLHQWRGGLSRAPGDPSAASAAAVGPGRGPSLPWPRPLCTCVITGRVDSFGSRGSEGQATGLGPLRDEAGRPAGRAACASRRGVWKVAG